MDVVNTQQQLNNLNENTKKWQCKDRYQTEIENKLALALSSLGLPLTFVQDSHFKNLLETAQPKFTMPSSVEQMQAVI